MARLPAPGSDDGTWGQILNDFLVQAHAADGNLKAGIVGDAQVSSLSQEKVTGLSTALSAKADNATTLHTSGDETVTGIKTFSTAPLFPTPTAAGHASTKAYANRVAVDGQYVTGTYSNKYELSAYVGTSNESSTFSGWAGYMGTPQDFDTVVFKVKNRDTTTLSNVRVIISVFNKAGTVLVDKIFAVSIAAGITQTLTLDLGTTIANTAGSKLYFGYQGDKLVSFTYMNAPAIGDDIVHGRTNYTVVSQALTTAFTAWANIATATVQTPWVNTFKKDVLTAPIATAAFMTGSKLVSKDALWNATFQEKLFGFNSVYSLKPFSGNPYVTSTFSGWGSYIGTPQSFDKLRFKVKNRSSNVGTMTRIDVYLLTASKTGTQLAYNSLTVSIAPGVESDIIWDIGSTIANTAASQLYFIFQCNQLVDMYAATITPAVADGTYCARTSYITLGSMVSPASMADVGPSPTSNVIWTEAGTQATFYAPTDQFKSELAAGQNAAQFITYSNTSSGMTATNVQTAIDELKSTAGAGGQAYPRIILPDEVVGVVGDKLQLFVRPMIEAQNPYANPYEITCSIGKTLPRYFEVTPVTGDVGTKTMTVSIQDYSGTNKVTDTMDLVVVNPTGQPSSTKNVICIGDSLTDAKTWPAEAYRRLTQTGGSPTDLGYGNISFIGTDVMPGYSSQKQIGHGGWTWGNYAGTASIKAFTIQVASHDKDQADQKSLYTDGNGNPWWLETLATTSIKIIAYGHSIDLPASGTLTWLSGGTHHASITFTSRTAENSTPFWDSGTSQLSFTAFMNNNGYTGQNIDVIYVLLGWNGMPGQNKYLAADHVATTDIARTFITKLHEQYPNAKARIVGLQVPSFDGGLGTNYGATGTYANYYKLLRSVNGLNLAYQDLCNEPVINTYAKFIAMGHQFDSEYNMPSASVAANSRTATTEKQGTNGVHPDTPGYLQIGDAVYRDFIRSFCS